MTEKEKNETEQTVDTEAACAETAADESPPADDGSGGDDAPSADEKEKKGVKKKGRQDKQKERIADLENRVMRQMAEFENFRKRTEKEKSQMFEIGARSVIEKILPVVDNFERGLAAIPEADTASAYAEGMNMIYKQLMAELESLNVKVIPALGEEFNPDLHNAVMQIESGEYESGVIAQEMQKGYTYRDSVVRYSMVGVAQ